MSNVKVQKAVSLPFVQLPQIEPEANSCPDIWEAFFTFRGQFKEYMKRNSFEKMTSEFFWSVGNLLGLSLCCLWISQNNAARSAPESAGCQMS